MLTKEISDLCPCCSGFKYQNCCAPYHHNILNAPTPEALMRSRYAAYSLHLIDYLLQTTHYSVRNLHHREDIGDWAIKNTWLKLEILTAKQNKVRFKAYYRNKDKYMVHHEDSTFKEEDGVWYYLKGVFFN